MPRVSKSNVDVAEEIAGFVVLRSDRARRLRTFAWAVVQLFAALPLMFTFFTVLDMTFAIPHKGYVSVSQTYVACEALAPQYKRYSSPRCSRFGSMETNPSGYVLAIGACFTLGSFIWFSSLPGRGLRLSRSMNSK
jgi:hypothetical protein